jgi:Tfp pilus assembly protein PilO
VTGLEKLRSRFTLLLAIFLAIDVALIAYLLWPGTSSKSARHDEEQRLQQELIKKTRDDAPLKGIEGKLQETRVTIKKFYAERVLSQSSQISTELHKLAQADGVSMQAIHYKVEESGLPNLQRVDIDTAISGDYLKIAHFINALERDKLLFVINQISLTAPPGGTVQLQIRFQTFLKETA